MVRRDTRVSRLGNQKHEKFEKKGSKIDMLNTRTWKPPYDCETLDLSSSQHLPTNEETNWS